MIFVSDAREFMAGMADKSCDAVVTSPPYNLGVPYEGVSDARSDYVDWSLDWIREAVRISRQGLMLNIGTSASRQNQLFLLLGKIAENFKIQQTWIWIKSVYDGERTEGHFKPINSDRYCNNLHEYVFLINERGDSRLDKLSVGVPFEDKSNIARFSSLNKDKKDVRDRGSTWFLKYKTRVEKLSHPATYPVELAEMMISVVGAASVVDPFVGSGTTALAARRLGVEFSGCDLSEAYVSSAIKRLGV